MCLGLPAQVTSTATGLPDLVEVDMAGVIRHVNVGVLDDPDAVAVGDWLLVHMGMALEVISEDEAREALAALADEPPDLGVIETHDAEVTTR